ncbi:class I SAM-dependent methyltransferase [Pedococcus sp. KACC 23699]|uniref:Class I SAM-dependent methyltransferase n=1 Tax=Pedococcus sp. KACC 23699 TaxID=3149228 RepID=A0AAU7JNF6_9MICO
MPSTTPDPFAVEVVRHAYDTVAGTYATHLPDTRAEAPIDLAMVDSFIEAVGTGDAAAVLDAGCGTGRMSRYLADRGCAVQGVDLSLGMVAEACRAHPDLPFAVAPLNDLPFEDDQFAGVLLWYSTIHTAPSGQAAIFAEVARVLRPGGHVLVGFQSGQGVREVVSYRRFGHDVSLHRHLFTADEVASHLAAAGLTEVCRMQRAPVGREADGQAMVLARAD